MSDSLSAWSPSSHEEDRIVQKVKETRKVEVRFLLFLLICRASSVVEVTGFMAAIVVMAPVDAQSFIDIKMQYSGCLLHAYVLEL